uniref:Ig-like domain-containing protein n=1 Tax=Amphilophus citrinellus TaxID=61819 RepID=A0A3Q0QVH2_AMPCI
MSLRPPYYGNIWVTYGILYCSTGHADGSDVTQTSILWKYMGDSATMNCSHKKGDLYFQMYWYRQLPAETMKLIVFTTTGKKDDQQDFGDFSKEKFSVTKPAADKGTFTVKNLEPKDTGLYFCAVSQHNDTDKAES